MNAYAIMKLGECIVCLLCGFLMSSSSVSPVTLVKVPGLDSAFALVSFSNTPWQSFLPATPEEENKKAGQQVLLLCLDLVQST